MAPAGDAGADVAAGTAPLVSVVVATYNSRQTLGPALASVCRQTLCDFEVLVVGDGCTDGSGDVVEALRDPRVRWIGLERNSGSPAAPNNAGFAVSRGRYVAYLGHDDLWFPWHLATLVEAFATPPATFAIGLGALLGPGGVIEVSGPPPPGRSWRRHFVPPTNWLVERSLVERVGGWGNPDRLTRAVDKDLFQRLVASGACLTCVPRLTTIKFPSPWWRLYAPGSPRPQDAISDALVRDPERLCARILADIAQDHARRLYPARALPPGDAWRQALRGVRRAAGATVRSLEETPLVRPLMRWFVQADRRRLRRVRGLD